MDNQPGQTNHSGHRSRLRQRIITRGEYFEAELLEALLSYAIPRKDLKPLAESLIKKYGSFENIFPQSISELKTNIGLGEYAIQLIKLIGFLKNRNQIKELNLMMEKKQSDYSQDHFFEQLSVDVKEKTTKKIFIDDEASNTLNFLPKAIGLQTIEQLINFLETHLPYNAYQTRQRRSRYILSRFFSSNQVDIPLMDFFKDVKNQTDQAEVIFYEILRAEPLASSIAENVFFQSLSAGLTNRKLILEQVRKELPEKPENTYGKIFSAIYHTYMDLGILYEQDGNIVVGNRIGSLNSFVYVLLGEFPEASTYSFTKLESSAARKWLLWDKGWMKDQLYNLRDLGIISKVSEIDMVNQFTLAYNRENGLKEYFMRVEGKRNQLREK